MTYAYNEATCVVGPLAAAAEPHTWDLCEEHASRITAPLGWELVRYEGIGHHNPADEAELTVLAEAVRKAAQQPTGLVLKESRRSRVTHQHSDYLQPPRPAQDITTTLPAKHKRRHSGSGTDGADAHAARHSDAAASPRRTKRRGHLRLVED